MNTLIKQKAAELADDIIHRLLTAQYTYNKRTFESARGGAIIVARMLMKEYRNAVPAKLRTTRYDILKALPQAIESAKYKL